MELEEFMAEWNNSEDSVLVHTSGSTGRPKPMWAEKQRMLNSARITCDFLDLHEGDNALLCMPLDYIAGKMVVVRSIERAMNLISVPPSNHPLGDLLDMPDLTIHFAAMVPSQVFCSLQVPGERALLRRIRHLIIGGGAISPSLARELHDLFTPGECRDHFIWSTYGMTETLSHIALRRLNGPEADEWYTPFESVNVSLNHDGCLVIDAPLVHEGILTTNDIAEIKSVDGTNRFRIIGRKDNVICSGGIKLQIEEIEARLRPFLQNADEAEPTFCISKRTDEKFGEVAVLIVTNDIPQDFDFKSTFVHLDHYAIPKQIIRTDSIPLTKTGKIDRRKCEEII